MDEYDVFLDEHARQITLQTIKRYATQPEFQNIQFFIITPHNLKQIQTSKMVRIQQMPEPQRSSAIGLQQQTIQTV